MHGWETRMLLKYDLERGVSKAELSRRFGVSRRTIHEWVETGQLDRDLSSGGSRYAPRPPAPHKLDPYTGIIDARLEEYPGLSAQRLFDKVRAAGYPGGYSRVRDYVRAGRPREPTESVVRFEMPAGRQGQVDFATFTLPWGRRHALVVLLSHSRLLWLCFYRRQTMAVLPNAPYRPPAGACRPPGTPWTSCNKGSWRYPHAGTARQCCTHRADHPTRCGFSPQRNIACGSPGGCS